MTDNRNAQWRPGRDESFDDFMERQRQHPERMADGRDIAAWEESVEHRRRVAEGNEVDDDPETEGMTLLGVAKMLAWLMLIIGFSAFVIIALAAWAAP